MRSDASRQFRTFRSVRREDISLPLTGHRFPSDPVCVPRMLSSETRCGRVLTLISVQGSAVPVIRGERSNLAGAAALNAFEARFGGGNEECRQPSYGVK